MISKMRDARRILENATEPRQLAKATVDTYDRIARAAQRAGLGYCGYVRSVAQSAPARLRQTCFALIHRLKAALWKLRSLCGDRVAELAAHSDLVIRIDSQLSEIETIKKSHHLERTGQKRSKRQSLARKPANLDLLIANCLTAAARPAGLAVILTGARPAEIEKGVTFTINQEGLLEAAVLGAKCTDLSGQKLRTLTFDPKLNAVAAQLTELVRANAGVLCVSRKARRLHKDIARAAKAAGFDDISPYSFRHLFASRRKQEVTKDGSGNGEIEIAKSLGHQATKTQSRYGSARLKIREGSGVVRVSATSDVRLNHDRPDSTKYTEHTKKQPSAPPLDHAISP